MKIIYLTFSLDHEMLLTSILYITTKFKAAVANGLGEDTITRNRTHERTRTRMKRRTDRLWYVINVPFFLQVKAGINVYFTNTSSKFKR